MPTMQVTVIPTNREPPVFTSSNTMVHVENVPASAGAPAIFGRVTASDPDGPDANITFSIDHANSGAGSTLFAIESGECCDYPSLSPSYHSLIPLSS